MEVRKRTFGMLLGKNGKNLLVITSFVTSENLDTSLKIIFVKFFRYCF
jgi:hypothetical protein